MGDSDASNNNSSKPLVSSNNNSNSNINVNNNGNSVTHPTSSSAGTNTQQQQSHQQQQQTSSSSSSSSPATSSFLSSTAIPSPPPTTTTTTTAAAASNAANSAKAPLRAWWSKLTRHTSPPPGSRPSGIQGSYSSSPSSSTNPFFPIFGSPLSRVLSLAKVAISTPIDDSRVYVFGYVPVVVAKCGLFLKDNATNVEGIFRLAGHEKRIADLCAAFNTAPLYGRDLDWTGYTVHDAGSVLRRFFKQLPESVVPPIYQAAFLEALPPNPEDEKDVQAAIDRYHQLIAKFPKPNQYLFLYMLDLLAVFHRNAHLNRMTASNIAKVFQPSLFERPHTELPYSHPASLTTPSSSATSSNNPSSSASPINTNAPSLPANNNNNNNNSNNDSTINDPQQQQTQTQTQSSQQQQQHQPISSSSLSPTSSQQQQQQMISPSNPSAAATATNTGSKSSSIENLTTTTTSQPQLQTLQPQSTTTPVVASEAFDPSSPLAKTQAEVEFGNRAALVIEFLILHAESFPQAFAAQAENAAADPRFPVGDQQKNYINDSSSNSASAIDDENNINSSNELGDLGDDWVVADKTSSAGNGTNALRRRSSDGAAYVHHHRERRRLRRARHPDNQQHQQQQQQQQQSSHHHHHHHSSARGSSDPPMNESTINHSNISPQRVVSASSGASVRRSRTLPSSRDSPSNNSSNELGQQSQPRAPAAVPS